MSDHQNNQDNKTFQPAKTGNASNPSEKDVEPGKDQLLNEKAEKYLREVSSPEDYPDAQDEQEMEETIKKEKE